MKMMVILNHKPSAMLLNPSNSSNLIKTPQNSHPSELSPQVQLQHIRQLHLLLTDLALAALAALAALPVEGIHGHLQTHGQQLALTNTTIRRRSWPRNVGFQGDLKFSRGLCRNQRKKASVYWVESGQPAVDSALSVPAVPFQVSDCASSASQKKHGPKQSGKPK